MGFAIFMALVGALHTFGVPAPLTSALGIMKPFFRPWIGKYYGEPGFAGLRVMILGESHYGEEHEEKEGFTCEWVQSYANNVRANRFFTVITKLFLGASASNHLSPSQRQEFWSHVAFYNYVQRFPSTKARVRPNSQHWQAAEAPLAHVLKELDPQFVLILGRDLERHVINQIVRPIVACAIPHPSSFGFRRNTWSLHVQNKLHEACNSATPCLLAPA